MRLSAVFPAHLLLLIISSLDGITHGLARADPTTIHSHIGQAYSRPPPLHHETRASRSANMARSVEVGVQEDEKAICYPAGACEPCPEDLLQEPFCQPFGNRRLLRCLSAPPAPNHDSTSSDYHPNDLDQEGVDAPNAPPISRPPTRPPQSALPAWESCGRRVPKERADFFEFVLCNIIFAALALVGVLIRSERMRAVRARRLAARIGVGLRRASSGGWAVMGGMGAPLASSAEGEGLMGPDPLR